MTTYACYCLQSLDRKRTYIGATVDVDRRLDQHNRKLSGGAVATAGRVWERVLFITGFPTWNDALKFEWAWKNESRKIKGFHLGGRVRALWRLLQKRSSTSTAMPYSFWSQNFRMWALRSRLSELEKIEDWDRLLSGGCLPALIFPSFRAAHFPILSFHSKMSSTNISVEQFQELAGLVEALKLDVETLKARMTTETTVAEGAEKPKAKRGRKPKAAAAEAPAAPAAPADGVIVPLPASPAEEKPKAKRGRKPKAAAVDEAPAAEAKADAETSEDEGAKKVRKPREKKVCPAAAEGVIRFAGSSGENKYRVFSNLYKSTFVMDGREFPTVEHYLAYAKFAESDAEYAATILAQKNPALVTGMARSKDHAARTDWDTKRNELLTAALAAKFTNTDLSALLKETGEAPIEFETTTDAYMGIGAAGTGENMLGKALMALRATC